MAPVIAENQDTIHSIMGGFIGFSGDMAESSQYPPVDRNRIMKSIYDNLVAPNDIYYIVFYTPADSPNGGWVQNWMPINQELAELIP